MVTFRKDISHMIKDKYMRNTDHELIICSLYLSLFTLPPLYLLPRPHADSFHVLLLTHLSLLVRYFCKIL